VKNGDSFAACAERFGITAREGEIIRLLLEGKDSKRITEDLFISDHTVKNHIHHIYQKLGVKNRFSSSGLQPASEPARTESARRRPRPPRSCAGSPFRGLRARCRPAPLA
jgi:DNA-binding CsgD family transcriptional regulator